MKNPTLILSTALIVTHTVVFLYIYIFEFTQYAYKNSNTELEMCHRFVKYLFIIK